MRDFVLGWWFFDYFNWFWYVIWFGYVGWFGDIDWFGYVGFICDDYDYVEFVFVYNYGFWFFIGYDLFGSWCDCWMIWYYWWWYRFNCYCLYVDRCGC